jgi:NTE family protein
MGQLQKYAHWVKTLNKMEVWGLLDFTLTSQGLIKGETVFNKMKEFIPDMNIQEMKIPFSAVASDLINEEEVVFDKGSFYEAARASMAIPALFTPVKYNNTILVDGGILSPVPIPFVKRSGNDILVVVNLYGKKNRRKLDLREKNKTNSFLSSVSSLMKTGDKQNIGYFSLLTHTSATMIHKLARLTIEKYNPDIVINIPADAANTFDFFKAKELIKLGEKAAVAQLSKYL